VLDQQIQRHRNDVARVAAGLAEDEIAGLTGTEVADVPGAQATHAEAMAALTRAAGAASEADLRCRQTREAADELLGALAAHAEGARRAAPVLRAAALATAGEGNTIDTTLATYVLLRRFEDVVAAANDRLSQMSDGRYTLERIDEREGGQRSRKAGLGLRVRDHVTDVPRDPHTLSGGETFYVSLCLALGLADVVRSEAGGVELGTLFVDEGFGSLDPGTLDAVMTELGRLREGGRSVGIVSHVADLKDRIPERIEVRRLPSGASTLTVRC
jgi:exonuclease SbcC